MSDDKSELLQDFILDGLGFKSMTERQDEVAEAHGESFEWIFQSPLSVEEARNEKARKPGSDFLPWLADNAQGLYWISGKAGSGKSTLMRFLSDHSTTRKTLQVWAGGLPLSVAGFFFWTSGSIEQRSQAGLLRSLLWQLLDQQRSFVKLVFPDLWAQCWQMSTRDRIAMKLEWSLDNLMLGLRLYVQHIVGKTRACLLIDGLDEFEGDHEMIINLFKTLQAQSAQHLKVCLSSRPWPVFETAFKAVPQFKLQDLTLHDMTSYVRDKFRQSQKMRKLISHDLNAEHELTAELVQRADGVFLWVVMVVGALPDDLAADDRLADVQHRLRQFPTDLDKLFRHVLFERLSKPHLESATRYFQLIRAREIVCEYTGDQSNGTLTLWEVATSGSGSVQEVIATEIHQLSQNEILDFCTRTAHNIRSRSAGLLEVHKRQGRDAMEAMRYATDESEVRVESIAYGKVTFLHRTVRDFLIYSGVWNEIVAVNAEQIFDSHLQHLKSYVLQLKLLFTRPKLHRRLEEWWTGIVLAMTHARYSSQDTTADQVSLLDELNTTLESLWQKRKLQDPDDHWARNAFGSYEARRNQVFRDPFLSLATKFGLKEYLDAKLGTGQFDHKGGQPLLSHAVEYLVSRQKTVYPHASPDMVATLFKHGADSNVRYRDLVTKADETPWTKALGLLQQADRRGWIVGEAEHDVNIERWMKVFRLFVENGADTTIPSVGWAKDASLTAKDIFAGLVKKYNLPAMKELHELVS
jgi:hypothetical protein